MKAHGPVKAAHQEEQPPDGSTIATRGDKPSANLAPMPAEADSNNDISPHMTNLVARCLRDLTDDWHRKGHNLSYDDVVRVSTKRDLDGMQLADLLEALGQAGIELTGIDGTEPAPMPTADDDDVVLKAAGSSADRD